MYKDNNKTDLNMIKCPLCKSVDIYEFYFDKERKYLQCGVCNLVFVSEIYFLSKQEEKKRYDLHQNNSEDQNYRKFLNRIFLPMKEKLLLGSFGLDFGSGPGPTLSVMFQEIGHKVDLYDYFYAQDSSVFQKEYDFITATEVLEHLHHPQKELDRLWACLKQDGTLGIMTKLVLNKDAFAFWHYKNDPTHVCFFSKTTFYWLADKWQAEVSFIDNDVIIFYKSKK
jgi:hypothetical protein